MTVHALTPAVSARQPESSNLILVDQDFIDKLKPTMAAFAEHLQVMKGLGRSTISNYRKVMARVAKQIGTLEPDHALVKRYIAGTFNQGYSFSHITMNMRAIELYMDFIGDPIKFGRPKKPKRIVKDPLTEAEVSVIISHSKNIREKAIIALLACSGARNQELCDLRVQDIDFGSNSVHILNGKGAKSRTVYITGECTTILLQYLNEHPRPETEYMFTTLRHRTQYTPWALRRLIKKVVAKAGMTKRVHPHLFRHSLATNMLGRDANIQTIQQILGHEFIDTTMIYIKSRPQRVAAEYQMRAPSYI